MSLRLVAVSVMNVLPTPNGPTPMLLTNFHQVSCLPNLRLTGSQCVSFPFHWHQAHLTPDRASMPRLRLDGQKECTSQKSINFSHCLLLGLGRDKRWGNATRDYESACSARNKPRAALDLGNGRLTWKSSPGMHLAAPSWPKAGS